MGLGFLAGALLLVGWLIVGGFAQDISPNTGGDEQPVGRYQAVAPDLVLDTSTGKLTTSAGQMLEAPIEAAGKEVGRFSAAGYVTAVTRSVGLDVMNTPVARTDLVKGYVIVDTKSGRVVRKRIYESRPLRANDL